MSVLSVALQVYFSVMSWPSESWPLAGETDKPEPPNTCRRAGEHNVTGTLGGQIHACLGSGIIDYIRLNVPIQSQIKRTWNKHTAYHLRKVSVGRPFREMVAQWKSQAQHHLA
jgi:hypothetical protein